MSERGLAPLQALGDELRRLGAPPPARGRLTPRALLAALALVLALAGVATAAILITRGAPLAAPNAADLEAGGVPLAATARLAGLDAPDPEAGQPPWDIRLSRTRAGETCTAVGQVLDGQFGIVGLDHVFRALPLGGVDACGVNSPDGPVLAGARVFVGEDPAQARTVVNGVAGAGARSVTVYTGASRRALTLGPQGSFITVYAGYVEEVRPRVLVRLDDGRSRTIAFAQSSAYEVRDPLDGAAWEVSGGADLEAAAYPDENCAQASEQLGRTNPSRLGAALTPEVCGRLGSQPLFVAMRRFVPGSGEHTGFPWGDNPARTLVYGAAAARVRALRLSGAGAPRSVPIDRRGGVFLAVLDGHVDPRALKLTALLADGRTLVYRRSTKLFAYNSNRPLQETPVPAYREALPRSQAEPPPPDIPVAASVRAVLRARDPAGGAEWALRSWQGTRNARASFGAGVAARFTCLQVGVIERGRLVGPAPGSPPLRAGGRSEAGGGGCSGPRELTRYGPLIEVTSYLADPYAYAPKPLRTVVSGLSAPGSTAVTLLGAGAPRPLRTDANGAFLAVLPGRYWDARLRVAVTLRGRRLEGPGAEPSPGAGVPERPQARAPDPNGGAPWGFAAGADGSSAYGRIVDGRLAVIDERAGTLVSGPDGWSGGGGTPAERRLGPVRFETEGGPEEAFGQSSAALPEPQVERRTLPGRTIITGIASDAVTSVTLITPRDVRTLRPSGPRHVFIVVYDGEFFHGTIAATVALRGGRTVTEQVPNGPGGGPPLRPREPTPSELLRGLRRQIAAQRRHPHPLPRFAPKPPPLERIAASIERRIAYERSHPGVLPAA